jgi:hypothetical protein
MHKLTILKEDSSVYWVEHFNSEEEANRWIAEEVTRPYWVSSYTYQIEKLPEPNPVFLEQQLQILNQEKNSAKQKLKALGLTDAEINAIIGI